MNPLRASCPIDSPEALARAVILALTADDAIDAREVDLLRRLDAARRIGMPESEFLALARAGLQDMAGRLTGKAWLSLADTEFINGVLDRVVARSRRVLVCRLVAGVITADGRVAEAERLVYEHMLMRWRIGRIEVADAIRADPTRPLEPADGLRAVA